MIRRLFIHTHPSAPSWALLILRIAMGVILICHGGQKLFGWFGGKGLDATVQSFNEHHGFAPFLTYLSVGAEFFGGLALLLGLFTRFFGLVVAVGMSALMMNDNGNNNAALGYNALVSNTSGSGNTAIGVSAGQTNTAEDNNTYIGYGADMTNPGITNATAIGAFAQAAQSNTVILGNGADVGIRTSTPAAALDVNGTMNASGTATFGGDITVTGATTLNGATTMNGTTVINSGATVNGMTTLTGAVVVKTNSATASSTIVIPNGTVCFHVNSASGVQTNAITMPAGTEGQILYIINDDDDDTSVGATVPAHKTRMFVFMAGSWRMLDLS